MMAQYHRIKASYPDALLLFRLGDFYETFYGDAETASRVLGLTLTSRQKNRDGTAIPLAGIPFRTLDSYLARLLRAGYKVAVCDQVGEARPGKTLVEREVVEVVTAGTAVTEGLLPERQSNYLAAISSSEGKVGLAFADLATGSLDVGECAAEDLESEWLRFAPREVVELEAGEPLLDRLRSLGLEFSRVERPADEFDAASGAAYLKARAPERAGEFEDLGPARAAVAALAGYIRALKKAPALDVLDPRRFLPRDTLLMDGAARRNLEVFETTAGLEEGSLLRHLDRTVTASGARHLRGLLERPLMSPEAIRERQGGLEAFLVEPSRLRALRETLTPVPDMERLLGRIGAGRSSPRDLGRVREALQRLPRVREITASIESNLVRAFGPALDTSPEMQQMLEAALQDELPLLPGEGGMIRAGHDVEVDRLRDLALGGKEWLVRFEADERASSGIAGLKAGYHSVFGYYLEVTRKDLERVPAHYIRRQTLASAERFTTEELRTREREILSAEEDLRAREMRNQPA